jgi:hypothetical protein
MSVFVEWVDGIAVLYWHESTSTVPVNRSFLEYYTHTLNEVERWKKRARAAEEVADELAAVVVFAEKSSSFRNCIASNWIEKVVNDHSAQKETRND